MPFHSPPFTKRGRKEEARRQERQREYSLCILSRKEEEHGGGAKGRNKGKAKHHTSKPREKTSGVVMPVFPFYCCSRPTLFFLSCLSKVFSLSPFHLLFLLLIHVKSTRVIAAASAGRGVGAKKEEQYHRPRLLLQGLSLTHSTPSSVRLIIYLQHHH